MPEYDDLDTRTGPLAVRVLDLSGAIGAYCSKLLGDLGADVVEAEIPAGDELRRRPPFADWSGRAESLVFAAYNANKRGIVLDYRHPAALPLLEALARRSDVIIASPTGRRPVAGFDRDAPALSWARPDAIVASITPFGLTGPLRDFQGRGPKDFLLERYDVARLGQWGRSVGVGIPPTGVWSCADGPLAVAVHQKHHWQSFLATLDHPEELADPAFEDPLFRREIFDVLEHLIAPLMARQSRLELFEKGQTNGLPCAPYNTPGDFVMDIQAADETFSDP